MSVQAACTSCGFTKEQVQDTDLESLNIEPANGKRWTGFTIAPPTGALAAKLVPEPGADDSSDVVTIRVHSIAVYLADVSTAAGQAVMTGRIDAADGRVLSPAEVQYPFSLLFYQEKRGQVEGTLSARKERFAKELRLKHPGVDLLVPEVQRVAASDSCDGAKVALRLKVVSATEIKPFAEYRMDVGSVDSSTGRLRLCRTPMSAKPRKGGVADFRVAGYRCPPSGDGTGSGGEGGEAVRLVRATTWATAAGRGATAQVPPTAGGGKAFGNELGSGGKGGTGGKGGKGGRGLGARPPAGPGGRGRSAPGPAAFSSSPVAFAPMNAADHSYWRGQVRTRAMAAQLSPTLADAYVAAYDELISIQGGVEKACAFFAFHSIVSGTAGSVDERGNSTAVAHHCWQHCQGTGGCLVRGVASRGPCNAWNIWNGKVAGAYLSYQLPAISQGTASASASVPQPDSAPPLPPLAPLAVDLHALLGAAWSATEGVNLAQHPSAASVLPSAMGAEYDVWQRLIDLAFKLTAHELGTEPATLQATARGMVAVQEACRRAFVSGVEERTTSRDPPTTLKKQVLGALCRQLTIKLRELQEFARPRGKRSVPQAGEKAATKSPRHQSEVDGQ